MSDTKKSIHSYGTNWSNINLSDAYERNLNMLDPYSFDTLLLEISCGLSEITRETITAHFETVLKSKIDCARETFQNNLNNILKDSKQYQELI